MTGTRSGSSRAAHAFARGAHGVDFVLVEPSHPGNIGAAARALRTMGFARLTVVAPRLPGAVRDPRARALASGAFSVLDAARTVDSLPAALEGARLTIAVSAAGREFAASPASPRTIAPMVLHQVRSHAAYTGPAPVALVFGTERTGLSIAQAQLCQLMCAIPADPDYSSLNLAQAVQVLAYELRQAWLQEPPDALETVDAGASPASQEAADPLATNAQLEGLYAHLQSSLEGIGFLDPAAPKRLMPRLRRLLNRAAPTTKEVDILRGICTRMDRLRP